MKKYIIPISILVISIFLSISFYSVLPDSMASHWNISGDVDGYSSKLFNILFFPILQIFLLTLLIYIPRIDPMRKNILIFEDKFHLFVNSILTFMVLLQLFVFLWNIDIQIPVGIVMPMLMGILFIIISVLVKHAKQNYTIGIRTPWTLHSEKVWDKTHLLGSKLFLISGILSILFSLFPSLSFSIVIGSVLISTLILFIYSYVEFKKEK